MCRTAASATVQRQLALYCKRTVLFKCKDITPASATSGPHTATHLRLWCTPVHPCQLVCFLPLRCESYDWALQATMVVVESVGLLLQPGWQRARLRLLCCGIASHLCALNVELPAWYKAKQQRAAKIQQVRSSWSGCCCLLLQHSGSASVCRNADPVSTAKHIARHSKHLQLLNVYAQRHTQRDSHRTTA